MPISLRRLYVALGVLCAVLEAPASGTRLPVQIYTTMDGLGRDAVTCIVPDSKGFLWLCTSEGLSRFDGYQFVTYGVAQGLADRSVNAVLETRQGIYLVGTDRGVSRLDPAAPPRSAKRFLTIPPPADQPTPQVNLLVEDRSGAVWCATSLGLYRIDFRNGAPPVLRLVELNAAPQPVVTSLAEDGFGSLWVGTGDGLYRRWPDGRIECQAHGMSKLPHDYVRALMADRQGNLWMGTLRGLWRFAIPPAGVEPALVQRYGVADGLASDRIHSLAHSATDGSIWVGTAMGLGQFLGAGGGKTPFRSYSAAEGLSGRAVLSLGEDQRGSLWAGVDHGLARIARDGFATYTADEGIGPLSIVQVHEDDTLWAVSNQPSGLLLHQFENGRFVATRPRYPASMHYFGWATGQAVLHDREGEWWISTGEGLCRFPKSDSIAQLAATPPIAVYTMRSGLPANDVFRLFEDARGDIWVTTLADQGRLTRWERRRNVFHHYTLADCPGVPTGFAEDRAGNLWIGFSNEAFRGRPSGLLRYRDGRFEPFYGTATPGWILALYVDHAGTLWVGSSDAGLGRVENPGADRPRLAAYAGASALSSATVRSIAEDHSGRLYLGTPRGVDRIDPQSGRIKHYTVANGLASGVPASLICDRKGRIWVGTSMGLSMLPPNPDRPSGPPAVFITGVAAGGESRAVPEPGVASLSGLRFEPAQHQVRIEFVGLGAEVGESVQYQYRLLGIDNAWSALNTQRSVNFARLGSGRFHFLVRGVTGSGGASIAPAEVSFEIPAPVWQRWWFLSLAAVFVCGLALLAHRYDIGRRLEMERLRLRIAADLHDDLGASLSRVAILTEVVNRRSRPADPEAARHLTEIADIARGMVDGLGDLVWAIDPRRDDFASMARRIRGYASDVFEAQGTQWALQMPSEGELPTLRPDQRRHLWMIFQEAICNAARHSGCNQVRLSLLSDGNCLVATIADNGRGLPDSLPDAGNGLRNLNARAMALRGTLSVNSTAREGTVLTIRFPLPRPGPGWGRIAMLFRRGDRAGPNQL
jgi:ligand-binding sensor domain-containing protein/signal transduction histidine kinase